MIEIIEEFIQFINANPEIMKFMLDNKMDVKNIEFSIGFYDDNYRHHMNGKNISKVSCIVSKLFYSIYDHDTKMFKKKYEEPYTVAKSLSLKIS